MNYKLLNPMHEDPTVSVAMAMAMAMSTATVMMAMSAINLSFPRCRGEKLRRGSPTEQRTSQRSARANQAPLFACSRS